MTRDEMMEELIAAEERGDIEAAEYQQGAIDEMDGL